MKIVYDVLLYETRLKTAYNFNCFLQMFKVISALKEGKIKHWKIHYVWIVD